MDEGRGKVRVEIVVGELMFRKKREGGCVENRRRENLNGSRVICEIRTLMKSAWGKGNCSDGIRSAKQFSETLPRGWYCTTSPKY